jgi:hypothetical protein
MNQIPLSAKNKINSRAKNNPALLYQFDLRTGLQYLFYKPKREVSAFRSIKHYKTMKTISFYMAAVFVLFTFHGITQVKVYEDNRVKIFGERPTDDPNKDLSMQIYGSYGEYLTNGRLGFGDYGRVAYNGSNVFIGELGTNWDSDKLQLHGKKGIYLTWGRGYDYNEIIGKWDISQPDRFSFETDVYAKGVLLSSDSRFKENIKPLGKKLTELKRLNGISYNLKREKRVPVEGKGDLTEKEQNDLAMLNNLDYEERTRLGFVAQEVQQLFPELVQQDAEGYLYIDYVGLIPVLVESVKEQQEQIDELLELAAKKGLLTTEK